MSGLLSLPAGNQCFSSWKDLRARLLELNTLPFSRTQAFRIALLLYRQVDRALVPDDQVRERIESALMMIVEAAAEMSLGRMSTRQRQALRPFTWREEVRRLRDSPSCLGVALTDDTVEEVLCLCWLRHTDEDPDGTDWKQHLRENPDILRAICEAALAGPDLKGEVGRPPNDAQTYYVARVAEAYTLATGQMLDRRVSTAADRRRPAGKAYGPGIELVQLCFEPFPEPDDRITDAVGRQRLVYLTSDQAASLIRGALACRANS